MSRYALFDRSRLELLSLAARGHELTFSACLPLSPPEDPWDHPELAQLVERIGSARRNGYPVIAMIGAHPIKLGLSRFLIDLIESRLITHLATNGAGIIHDFELALAGGTSE